MTSTAQIIRDQIIYRAMLTTGGKDYFLASKESFFIWVPTQFVTEKDREFFHMNELEDIIDHPFRVCPEEAWQIPKANEPYALIITEMEFVPIIKSQKTYTDQTRKNRQVSKKVDAFLYGLKPEEIEPAKSYMRTLK